MDELQLRQATVKQLLTDYSEPLKLNAKDPAHTDALLDSLKLRLEERGVPLYAEEILMGVTVLEAMLDVAETSSGVETQATMATVLLAFLSEMQDRWDAKDRDFFVD